MSEPRSDMVMPEDIATPERHSDPCVLVIFGASGDLTRRLLVPSLHNLAHDRLLSQNFAVVGLARNAMTHEDFRQNMQRAIHESTRVGQADPVTWLKNARRRAEAGAASSSKSRLGATSSPHEVSTRRC